MKSDWSFGTVVRVKDIPRLGRGIVTKWKSQDRRISIRVIFPHRDYSRWFDAGEVEKVSAVDLLSAIAQELSDA